MKKIIFIRPAEYSYVVEGNSLLDSFDLIGSNQNDPSVGVISGATQKRITYLTEKYRPSIVYSSNANRCKNTAGLFTSQPYVSKDLNEVDFDLIKNLGLSHADKNNFDVDELRFELIKAFTENKLEEKPEDTIKRINSFLNSVKNGEGTVLCVSHAFIMKLYEIYLKQNMHISNPKQFLSEYNWFAKPYEFLGGYEVSFDEKGSVFELKSI